LIPDLELESDVLLKAGSFLITCKDLKDSLLDEKVIKSLQGFGAQIMPESHRANIKVNDRLLEQLKKILDEDVKEVAGKIEKGKEYPNFLKDSALREKVIRIMEKLTSNPDLITIMYEFKVGGAENDQTAKQIYEHSIRVALLAVALGLQLRWSVVSLINVGIAGIFHDIGITRTDIYENLKKLDDYVPAKIETFVKEHQKLSVEIFEEKNVNLLQMTKNEILHMIANHHRPNFDNTQNKTAILLYFAELLDEMISVLPHKVRYNFSSNHLSRLGDRYARRNGLVQLLLGMIKIFKDKSLPWQMVSSLITLFSLDELLIDGYEEKLKEIIAFCPSESATAFPGTGGNSLPRSIYCKKSYGGKFTCEHMSQVKIDIFSGYGKAKSYNKCVTLNDRLHDLNKSGHKEEESKEKE
ncbi:MAG: HD domain-containing protein, partial [Gemmatimonadota bacterium]|nr:HD domain-containing protein [Gemmatimonadota bacterium]